MLIMFIVLKKLISIAAMERCFDFCKQPKPCQDNLCINKDRVERSNLRSNSESVGLPCSKINRAPSQISLHLSLSFCLSLPSPQPCLFICFSGLIAHFPLLEILPPRNNTRDQLHLKLTLTADNFERCCLKWSSSQSVSQSMCSIWKKDRGNTAARSWLEAGKPCGKPALK